MSAPSMQNASSPATVAGLTMEASGHMPWLWGTAFVFGNLFATFWLIKAFLSAAPSIAYHLNKVSNKLKVKTAGSKANSKANSRANSRPSSYSHIPEKLDGSQAAAGAPASPEPCAGRSVRLQPVLFEWHNMGCAVNTPHGFKTLLQGVFGCAKPRQLHGLLGPSGAGKSTLLDLLTMRLRNDDCSGQLLINQQPTSYQQLARLSVYVPQHDNLVPVLTARESVEFAASIKMPQDTPAGARRARVDQVLELMGITEQKDMLVGGPLPGGLVLPGMSGSERKQLHIACGVVAGSNLVFLDEPTSGLDSCSALNIVMFMKDMATQEGATLLASVHQPRAVIWSQLDQVTLLASGRLMYTGATEGLVPWFGSLGYPYNPEVQGVVSDWALDLISLGFEKQAHAIAFGSQEQKQLGSKQASGAGAAGALAHNSEAAAALGVDDVAVLTDAAYVSDSSNGHGDALQQQQQQVKQHAVHKEFITTQAELSFAADAFLVNLRQQSPELFVAPQAPARRSTSAGGVDTAAAAPAAVGAANGASKAADGAAKAAGAAAVGSNATATVKYRALLWRELLVTSRNPLDMGGRMLTFTYLGLLWGLVCFNLPGGANTINDRMLVCYVTVAFYLLLPYVSMSIFTGDKGLFVADVSGRLYHPAQYYFSKLTVSLPLNALLSLVFQLIFWGMAGMRHDAGTMAKSCVISVLMGLVGMQAVYCCAVMASSQDLAFVYAIAWTCPNFFVNQFMQPFSNYSLGWGLSWLRYVSPSSFAWEALARLELEGRGFDCSQGSGLRALGLIPDLIPSSTPSMRLVKQRVNNLGEGCIASGDAALDMFTQGLPFTASVFILIGYFLLLLAATYVGVVKTSRSKH